MKYFKLFFFLIFKIQSHSAFKFGSRLISLLADGYHIGQLTWKEPLPSPPFRFQINLTLSRDGLPHSQGHFSTLDTFSMTAMNISRTFTSQWT